MPRLMTKKTLIGRATVALTRAIQSRAALAHGGAGKEGGGSGWRGRETASGGSILRWSATKTGS